MAKTLSIKPVFPLSTQIPPLTSTSQHVLRRSLYEIPSSVNGSFSYTTNNQIQFYINSNSDFLDLQNSYVRCQIAPTLQFEGENDSRAYLSEGGVQSVFSTMTIATNSGVVLQRIENYNRLYASLSNISNSPEFVDRQLAKAGDSVDYQIESPNPQSQIQATGSAFAIVYSTGVVTGTGTKFMSEVDVGDLVYIIQNVAGDDSSWGKVTVVTSDTSITLAGTGLPAASYTGTAMYIFKQPNQGFQPTRLSIVQNAMSNTSQPPVVCFKPFMLPGLSEALPLMLLRGGLVLTLLIDNPAFYISSVHNPISAGYTGVDCVLKNCTFVASLFQPDESLADAYVRKFRDGGLEYSFTDYRYNLNNIPSGNTGLQSFQLNVGARSARHVIGKLINQRAYNQSSATADAAVSSFTCDGIAQALKANMQYLLFESGSFRYPLARPLNIVDPFNNELLQATEEAFGGVGSEGLISRWYPYQWQSLQTSNNSYQQGALAGVADSQKLCWAVNLSRDVGSRWAGLDLTLNALSIQLTLSSSAYQTPTVYATSGSLANQQLYLLTWVGVDSSLSISSDSVTVIR